MRLLFKGSLTPMLERGVLCFAPPIFFTWSLPASTFIDPLLWLLVAMAAGLYLARGSFTGGRGKRAGGMRGPPWLPRFERMNGGSLPRAIGAADVYAAHPGKFGLVVVSGKAPGTPDTALAMADALALFGVPRDRIAVEPDSETTRANAENTARLLKERGIETSAESEPSSGRGLRTPRSRLAAGAE